MTVKKVVLLVVLLPLSVVGGIVAVVWVGLAAGFIFMSMVIGDAANGR